MRRPARSKIQDPNKPRLLKQTLSSSTTNQTRIAWPGLTQETCRTLGNPPRKSSSKNSKTRTVAEIQIQTFGVLFFPPIHHPMRTNPTSITSTPPQPLCLGVIRRESQCPWPNPIRYGREDEKREKVEMIVETQIRSPWKPEIGYLRKI